MKLTELDEKIAASEERLKQLRFEVNQLAADLEAAKAFRAAYPRLMGEPEGAPCLTPVEAQQVPLIPRSDVPVPELVRIAIAKCGIEYTVYDVERILAENGDKIDRIKISQLLSAWARKGKIFIKHHGVGKTASVYTKQPSPETETQPGGAV